MIDYATKYRLKVSNTCDNDCIYCNFLCAKAKYNKTLKEIKKELKSLKKKRFKQIVFPCNTDCRKDFFEILKYTKSLNFIVTIETTGIKFFQQTFYEKTKNLVDSYDFIINLAYYDIINIIRVIKKISFYSLANIIIPITSYNCYKIKNFKTLLSNLPDVKNIIFLIIPPSPKIYKELSDINIKKNIKIIELPNEIKIEVTAKCNLNCQFCYNKNSFIREVPDLPKNDLFKIIDQIRELGIKKIRFTGGEPFLRNDIIELITYAAQQGIYITVNTNGILLNRYNLKLLSKKVDRFLLPFHFFEKKEINRLIKLISEIKKVGIDVVVNTILIKENIKKLELFYNLIKKINVRWFLARPIPTKENKVPINNNDIQVIIKKILGFREIIPIDNIPFCSFYPQEVEIFSQGARMCGIFDKLVISPTGEIKPCYSINEKIGEATKGELKKAWEIGLSYEIRKLSKFPLICKSCKYLYECLGGCRFAAYIENGSYDAMDPLARPEIFLR